jgi:RNA polymerase sigma-70 factor (ECF subfamily)
MPIAPKSGNPARSAPAGSSARKLGEPPFSAQFVEFHRQEAPSPDSLNPDGQTGREKGHSVESDQGPKERAVSACFLQLAQGRVQALSLLYDVLGKELFGYIRSIVGSTSDTEDVFQEVFARLASLQSKAVGIEKPLGYVYVMARNEAFKAIKKRGEHKEMVFDEGFLEAAAPQQGVDAALTPEEVEMALATLPVEQREVVVLKIYEGFTFAQIGELTEVSPNTAASRYRYAIDKLAEKLGRKAGSW